MNRLSVKQKITMAIAAVVLILLSFFSYLNYSQAKNRIVNQAENDISEVGRNLSVFVSNWIDTKQTILASAGLFSGDTKNHDQILEQGQKAGNFLYMYIGSDKGEMIMIPKENLPDGYDPRTRPWYQQAKKSNSSILTAPYIDASSGELVLSFARPTSIGVIAADIKMNDIATEILNITLGKTGQAFMVDGNNSILIHANEDYFEKPLKDIVTLGAVSDQVSEISIENNKLLAAKFSVEGTPWSIVVSVDKQEALSELTSLTIRSWVSTIATIVILTLVVSLLINIILNPLKELANALADIAKGDADLTKRLEVRSNDEIGQLSLHFNNFVESIHHMVIDVIDASSQLENIAKQTNEAAGKNNQAIQNQQSEITQVAAAIHEMSATSATVADNAKVTAESADSANKDTVKSETNAKENRHRMQSLTTQIDDTTSVIIKLNDQAMQINTILATIQGIAEQTNLLALNAAIEAARAGDQGRGFAVVADEVRALSQRTHEATGEIQSMIEALSSQTSSAVSQMEKSKSIVEQTMTTAQAVSDSQTSIKAAIEDINRQTVVIAEASREQNLATDEVHRISQAIQDESQRLSENVELAYFLSEQLTEIGEKVQNHLKRFRT